MPLDIDDLEEDELEQILNSKMVQKYLAYRDLANGIKSLQDDDVMYDQLIQGINERYSRVNKDTIKRVLEAFVNEVETNTTALETADDEGEDAEPLK